MAHGSNLAGLFATWNGQNDFCALRIGYDSTINALDTCFTTNWNYNKPCGTFAGTSPGGYHALRCQFECDSTEPVLLVITCDKNDVTSDGIRNVFYWGVGDNMDCKTGRLESEYYETFVNEAKVNKYIEIGRCNFNVWNNWCYLQGTCYCTMLYNRGLSDSEVNAMFEQMKLVYN